MSKQKEVELGSGGESESEEEDEGGGEGGVGGEDASLVRERQNQSCLTVSWRGRPFAFI